LRILHIHNVAGVSSLLAKYTDRQFGSESLVVTRKALDRYGLTDPGVVWDCGATEFTIRCVLKARSFDIVHVHDFDKVVRLLKFAYAGKPIVLEYHSYRFTEKWEERRKFWKRADRVLVSTPNLLASAPENVALLPNPIELARFVRRSERESGTAAYFIKHDKDDELVGAAKKGAESMGLSLQIFDVRERTIPPTEMPSLLEKKEYCGALSKTALEALALGGKVVRWDGQVVEGLPPEHTPERVVAQLYSIYKELLDTRQSSGRG
jgi:hypothetical protein